MQLSALATVHGTIIFAVATQLNAVIGSDSEQQFTDGGHGQVEKVRRIGNGRMIFALAGSSGFADSGHSLKLDFNHLIETALSGISPDTTLAVDVLKAAFLPVCASISSYISSDDKAFASIAFYPWISGVLIVSRNSNTRDVIVAQLSIKGDERRHVFADDFQIVTARPDQAFLFGAGARDLQNAILFGASKVRLSSTTRLLVDSLSPVALGIKTLFSTPLPANLPDLTAVIRDLLEVAIKDYPSDFSGPIQTDSLP